MHVLMSIIVYIGICAVLVNRTARRIILWFLAGWLFGTLLRGIFGGGCRNNGTNWRDGQ